MEQEQERCNNSYQAPYNTPVSTKTMRWGIVNEHIVRGQYRRIMRSHHSNLRLEETGLVVSTEIAYIDASLSTKAVFLPKKILGMHC